MTFFPIIGVLAYAVQDPRNPGWFYYANREQDIAAIQVAGGTALLLPATIPLDLIPALLERLDGIYLAGGGDIDGSFFGYDKHPLIKNIDRRRDEIELEIARLARQRALPTLGICRGCQVMNVAAGGSLIIDIHSEILKALQHRPKQGQKVVSHPVTLMESSRLASIYRDTNLTVNSYHHQSVAQPGKGLAPAAYAPDGVVEAIEAGDHPFYIGVQWHPERQAGNPPQITKIFNAFIQAAKRSESS
jgi:putative glutamine amidotransferase